MSDLADPPEILDEEEVTNEKEVISVYVKGHRFIVTPSDAVSIINQISGVLLAYGYSGGREQGQKKYSI